MIESTLTNSLSQTETKKATLQEVFSSIQGEGIDVGLRQLFIRFNACHLHCQYCDAPQRPATQACELHSIIPKQPSQFVENPITGHQLLEITKSYFQQSHHHAISLTGGEPLLYVDYLLPLLPELAQLAPIYLETSGTQPEALERVLPYVTTIAMDIKLESATGEPMQVKNHQAFYQLARTKRCFIKLVVSETTTLEELAVLPSIVTDNTMPIIIQPVTSLIDGSNQVSQAQLFAFETELSKTFTEVRIIPQTHKMLGVV